MIKLWDLETGQGLHRYRHLGHTLKKAVVQWEHMRLLSASQFPLALELWDLASGACTLTIEPYYCLESLPEGLEHVSVDWNSMTALTFSRYAIRLHNLLAGEVSTVYHAKNVSQLVESTLDAWVFKWPEL